MSSTNLSKLEVRKTNGSVRRRSSNMKCMIVVMLLGMALPALCAKICYNSTGPACQLSKWCTTDRRLILTGCSSDVNSVSKCVRNGVLVQNATAMSKGDYCYASFRSSSNQFLFSVECRSPLLVTCKRACCSLNSFGDATTCGDSCRADCVRP